MATATVSRDEREALVSLHDVYKVYNIAEPVPVLDGVSLAIPEGSFTAIMGPSGSGKSTLLNMIGCLDRPTSGRIRRRGRDTTQLSETELARIRRTEVGFVFQTFNLVPTLSARENVELPMVFAGRPRRERRERAVELLESVGLGDRVDHRPDELSGGQRQRVSIARALANDPTLILADEPTGSLDTDTGQRILDKLRQLNESGRTIVLVTHERHVAEYANRIVHVVDGRIESVEPVESRGPPEPPERQESSDSPGPPETRGPPDSSASSESSESHESLDTTRGD